MTFQQIEYYIQVAEIGSISECAKRMYVAQSSISSAIREIESHYGVKAFERNAKGVSLTKDGRELLTGLRVVAKQLEMLENSCKKKAEDCPGLSVAAQHHVCGFDAFQKIVAEEAADSYRFNYVECWSSDVYKHVRSGLADIGVFFIAEEFERNIIMELEQRNLDYHVLHREKLHVISHEKNPLMMKERIYQQDLHDYPSITYDYFGSENPIHANFILPFGRKIGVGDRACAYSLMYSANAFVTGSSYCHEDKNYRGIISRPVEDGGDIAIYCITRKDFKPNHCAQKFLELIQN